MFRIISIISFVVISLGIGLCCLVFPCCKECQWAPPAVLKRIARIFRTLFPEWKLKPVGAIRKLALLLALLSFSISFITGFYPLLILGESIHGYWLVLHVIFAPVFVICLAVLAVMWVENYCFNKNDWLSLKKVFDKKSCPERSQSNELLRKICFWLILLLALPVTLSILLSLLPLFGTDGQEFLLQLHRYSALLLALTAILHSYLMIRSQMGK